MQHEFSAPLSHAHTAAIKGPILPIICRVLQEAIKYFHISLIAGFSMLG